MQLIPEKRFSAQLIRIVKASVVAATGALLFACTSQDSITLPKGIELVETVTAKSDAINIPFKKYKLDNGLTVILHQDNSDPLVHVDVTYHVGSSREQLGKSGFAHFFEHMMFQGSQNVEDEEHFKVVTQSGGSLNGTTNTDRTNYFETVPKNQLEKMLWLESDRMGFLLETITAEKFEIQRATVKNERGQNVDNRPYGRLNETVNQMIYPREHPYSWPVIGYMYDLDRETVTDLKEFFSRWYGPNNAVLTIGGDIDEVQTLAWINKYFGGLKQGPAVESIEKSPVTLNENRYYSFVDNVSLPLLYISFPTVYGMHKDEAALDVLANILGNGPTSLLYKNLVKSGVAVQAGASHPCQELACKMSFYALPNPQQGLSLAKIEQVINDTLVEFETRGVNDDDLIKTKVSIETGTIYGLQSVSGKVSNLAHYQTILGDANYTEQQIARYNKVTKADVMRVFKQYIKGKGAAVLSIVPPEQEALATKKDNFVLPDITNPPELASLDTPLMKNISDFDRSIMPNSGENPTVKVPSLWRESFANGVEIIGTKNTETPTVSLLLSLEGGVLLDSVNKAGLASLTASLMNEGTTVHSKEQLSNELALLGSSISIGAGGRNSYVKVNSLVKNLDQTLALMFEMMFKPKFAEADFDRVKNQLIQSIEQGNKDASVLAAKALKQVTYGENNRLGLVDSGTVATVSAISLDDVKSFYKNYFSPSKASLVVVGDIEKKDLLSRLWLLKAWKGNDYAIDADYNFPEVTPNKIYFVDLPNANQSVIKLSRRAMPYDATGEYFKATLMNYPLGGAFNSRINLNLRENKGYTYGASSYFSGGKVLGQFNIGASVKKEHTYDAMAEIIKELTTFEEQGLTESEVTFMRQAISQSEALSYETPSKKSGFLRQLLQFNLPINYGEQQSDIIHDISIDELNALAKKELSQPMQWIVVGDGQVVRPQLEKLKSEIVELTLVK
ncbi:pitrilysin family protein [Colwellia sp. E2M01]|uniref:M16 family metallopeptidase n=1 Tax=Colwellia sp. E2M01 TaxID=2841561 RepID=UPI001C096668|nr:pitrilysin family protein [Colwellia sp. E2M01]MBU2871815.1 insulinase family protein [Colwellia sp. E2M01]